MTWKSEVKELVLHVNGPGGEIVITRSKGTNGLVATIRIIVS